MKTYIKSDNQEYIFAMSKIVKKYAIADIAEDIGDFIYFSECNSTHGPRIKFYGGTKETSSTKNSPSLKFDSEGNCEIELEPWMNRKNCPNAYDKAYVGKLINFLQSYISILLLVWFKHLDEADALAYFHGQISLESLFDDIDYEVPESINTLEKLDAYCVTNNLYRF